MFFKYYVNCAPICFSKVETLLRKVINKNIYYVNQDLNNFKILKISNSFYLKLDI